MLARVKHTRPSSASDRHLRQILCQLHIRPLPIAQRAPARLDRSRCGAKLRRSSCPVNRRTQPKTISSGHRLDGSANVPVVVICYGSMSYSQLACSYSCTSANCSLSPPKVGKTYLLPHLSLYHNCDSTAIRLRYDYDEKLTCSLFARRVKILCGMRNIIIIM